MKIFDIVYIAALNLYRRLGRSLLTVVGVIIGTASIILMIAIGLTNLAQFDEMLMGAELTKIQVMGDSALSYSAGLSRSSKLDDAATEAFLDIEHVTRVIPIKNIQIYAEAEGYYSEYLNIVAMPREEIPNMVELQRGDCPSSDSSMPQIIMGMGIAQQFIKTEDDYRNRDYKGPQFDWLKTQVNMYLGSRDILDNPDMPSSRLYRVNVVGIVKDIDEDNPSYDLYMDLERAKDIVAENYKLMRELNISLNTYDMVYVYVDKMENVKPALAELQRYGFEAYSDTEWIDEMQRQQRAQQGQLAAIGFISLIVSAIGIANTMMTGVLERSREIGVMKVVGVAIRKIRLIFLVEAAMIGLMGGLAGVILSHLFGYILSTNRGETMFLGMHFYAGMKLMIPFWLNLGAIAVAVIVGVIAGIFPAAKATNMSPLEAIRG